MKPRAIIYLFISLCVTLMSWEAQNAQAERAFHEEVSAEEAIRLRILADSDSIADQAVKREIRDEVNVEVTKWVDDLTDMKEAEAIMESRLDEIEEIVAAVLARRDLEQTYTVSLEETQFPTKLYGNMVYPAGIYKALLITLGEGQGENWWCVLFPPLCFVDMEHGEAVEQAEDTEETEELQEEVQQEEVETSFFFVDFFTSLWEQIFG
ncbi:stage II sporulation protein R [Shouchella lonarensis]|uniref:Stage II sporulation protein R n=1 Tax=Shouchella lonarensis TaxID=1464122 RepID=A0A1G6GWW6_9BACI|nr:stage II sporulation protein R [Shouchella lonarensis]SDB86383.1 stage II sporulation protein R [Shouchella lonarensis]